MLIIIWGAILNLKKNYLKIMLTIGILIVILESVLTGCEATKIPTKSSKSINIEKDPEKYVGTINMWSFTNEFETSGFIEKFNKVYPNIKVNLKVIPNENNAYSTNLVAKLASGVDAPDVFTSEVSYVNRIVNLPFYEDLSKAPYNGEEIAKNLIPYTVDLGRNQDDHGIRAFSWAAAPGGIFYKRSLAKKYFGTDDPDEISKKFSTVGSLIETGKELNEKSGGRVKLLPKYSEMYNVEAGSRTHAWVENNKLIIDNNIMKYIDYAKDIREAGIDANFSQWSAPWSASMAGEVKGTDVFSYVLPSWGLQYVLASNAPDTTGDWGFAKTHSAYYWGGTWIGMYNKSENKELAWQFIKYMTTSDFQTWSAKEHGDFPSNLDSAKQISTNNEGISAFVGGQNVAKAYNDIIPSINGKLVTKYDETIAKKFKDNLDLYINGEKTKEEFLEQFKADVKIAFPDLDVE